MKQRSFLILLFIFLLGKNENCHASHVVGADLTYLCLGGNNYRFFFTLYRDCSGVSVNPSYDIGGSSTCGDSIFLTVYPDSVREIAHTCSTVVTKCLNMASPYMGIEANYYHGDITIPSACNLWTFGLSPAICNRNGAITNLDPNGSAFCTYVEATLNNDAVQCNSSPSFSSIPVQFYCANQVQYYVEQAFDINGDSLTYQMIAPHSDSLNDVIYFPGLTATQPVTYFDSTRFNPLTGEVRFFANGPQITVMAIQVNEYHNGVLVGSVERDIELIFENCTNNLPTATGLNNTNIYSTHVCADSLVSFYIVTNDADVLDDTRINWNGGIPGASFFCSGGHRDVGYFSWNPSLQQVSTQPYTFSVAVHDNACPTEGINIYSYTIYVDTCLSTGIFADGNAFNSFSANYISINHSIHFKYKLGKKCGAVINLYDVTGREIKKVFIEKSAGGEMDLNVGELSGGWYFLNLRTTDGTSQSAKIVIE
ncbi:MAG: T9SS type A sorting domain-containing protein [Bacteroidota bacterium]